MATNLARQQNVTGWILITPVLIGTLVFSFIPVFYSLAMSFTEWNAMNPPKFTGLKNFGKILGGDQWYVQAVFNTTMFALGSIILGLIFGLGLALLANMKVAGQNFYRTAYFAPTVTSTIAIGIVWSFIFVPEIGLINSLLSQLFGIKGPDWLGSTKTALFSVIVVQTWFISGYNMVIYLAGLQGIPESLYESATIDGANRSAQFWHITLPMLSPTTFFLMITSFIASFQVFNLVFVMTAGGPGYATTVYIHYLYMRAFQYSEMGYASAMAWVLFIVIAGITVFQWKMQKHWVHYE
jgi:ABC-type sugar transport system permease subunit